MIGARHIVLRQGYIELLELTGYYNPNVGHIFQIITDAARTSYMGGNKGYDKDLKLLRRLYNDKHSSPFEQVEFTFRAKMPLFVAQQLTRHRVAEYNFMSGRYTEFQPEFYLPKTLNKQSETNKQGRASVHKESDVFLQEYSKQCGRALTLYFEMIEQGVSKEQARMVLPVSMFTTCYWKMNLRSLLNFISLRSKKDAQYEIRVYSDIIKEHFIKDLIPEVYELIE